MIASRVIAADAPTLLALVSDPQGQWRLVAGVPPLLRPHASAGTSRTRRLVPVRVQLRGRDVVWITWFLSPEFRDVTQRTAICVNRRQAVTSRRSAR